MILNLNSFDKIYFYKEYVDMRKQSSGLSVLVEKVMNLGAFDNNLYVFIGKRKNTVKLLYWDRSGFCLWQKKLEVERFHYKKMEGQNILELSQRDLLLWLEGYNIFKMKPHSTVSYKYVA